MRVFETFTSGGWLLRPQGSPAIFEVPDPLLLLGIDRQNRLLASQKLLDPPIDVTKLLIAARRRLCQVLDVSLQGVSHVGQSPPHGFIAHRVTQSSQLF